MSMFMGEVEIGIEFGGNIFHGEMGKIYFDHWND